MWCKKVTWKFENFIPFRALPGILAWGWPLGSMPFSSVQKRWLTCLLEALLTCKHHSHINFNSLGEKVTSPDLHRHKVWPEPFVRIPIGCMYPENLSLEFVLAATPRVRWIGHGWWRPLSGAHGWSNNTHVSIHEGGVTVEVDKLAVVCTAPHVRLSRLH